jgi:starch synthase
LVDILNQLEEGELFIMLGSGDPDAEAALTRISALHPNFLFLKGYANDLPELLYAAGDLFLMPSNFEPCGISQMLAMRAGQACVVHGVGGLKDTVEHLHNGFVFNASSPTEQAHNFVTTVKDALALKNSDSQQWKTIKKNAQDTRFDWEKSAQTYSHDLYAK